MRFLLTHFVCKGNAVTLFCYSIIWLCNVTFKIVLPILNQTSIYMMYWGSRKKGGPLMKNYFFVSLQTKKKVLMTIELKGGGGIRP